MSIQNNFPGGGTEHKNNYWVIYRTWNIVLSGSTYCLVTYTSGSALQIARTGTSAPAASANNTASITFVPIKDVTVSITGGTATYTVDLKKDVKYIFSANLQGRKLLLEKYEKLNSTSPSETLVSGTFSNPSSSSGAVYLNLTI